MTLEQHAYHPQTRSETGYADWPVNDAGGPQIPPPVKRQNHAPTDFLGTDDAVEQAAPANDSDGDAVVVETAPIATDWRRTLHWNFFEAEPAPRSTILATSVGLNVDAELLLPESPRAIAGALIGICIALWLAAAGIAHALSSPEVSAVALPFAPAGYTTMASADVLVSPARDAVVETPDRIDNSRECDPGPGIDSMCIFN